MNLLLRDFLGIALLAAFLVVAGNLAGDPGVGWHLRAGEWMSAHWQVLRHDVFLDTAEPRPWIHDQWLSDIIFWKIFSLGGMNLLQGLLLGSAILVYVGVLGEELGEASDRGLSTFLTLAILAPLASLQWFVRPVVFSFILFIFVHRLCRRWAMDAELGHADYLKISVIFLLWANLHPGFAMGLFLILITACAACWDGRRQLFQQTVVALVCASSCTLLNPYGADLYRSIAELVSNPFFMRLNAEWASPSVSETLFIPFFAVLLILAFQWLRGEKYALTFDRIAVVFFGAIALMQRRSIPYFAIATAIPLALALSELVSRMALRLFREQRGKVFLPGSFLAGILLISFQARYEAGREVFPPGDGAKIAARLAQEARGKVFHSPDLGGLITWYGNSVVRASIDDRNQVCHEDEYARYFTIALAGPGWKESLDAFEWAIVAKSDPVSRLLDRAGFQLAFSESTLQAFRRDRDQSR